MSAKTKQRRKQRARAKFANPPKAARISVSAADKFIPYNPTVPLPDPRTLPLALPALAGGGGYDTA